MTTSGWRWLVCFGDGVRSFCVYRQPRADQQQRECCIKHGKQLHIAGPEYDGLTKAQAREKWSKTISRIT